MDVIFLDIDGVLNDEETYKTERGPEGYTGVDEKYIRNLKYLVNNTGAEIVLSSDWRDEWHHNGEHGADMKYLLAKLGKYGLTIKDKTPGHVKGKGFSGRGREIAEYLNSHPEVENYVILDDNDFFDFADAPAKGHVVITVTPDPYGGYDYESGLTKAFANEAVNILKGGME